MDLHFSAAEERFRADVRAFIATELTPDLREAGAQCTGIYCDYPIANRWHRILARRGWSAPTWPLEHGGPGWSPVQLYIFAREMAEAGAPQVTPNATGMVAPAIMAFGTDEQKARYLPRILSGDDWWAQGYSEPGAGSDLASLRCAAARDGDSYVLNGSKIWTTHAHFSNRIFCLVRTRREGKPQQGISFLLFDLDLPGITIRPIISMSGDHELNEVHFDNVRVPVSALLGAENDGWTVAKYLLQHERGMMWSPLLGARLQRLRQRAAETAMLDDTLFAAKLADAGIRLSVLETNELRTLAAGSDGPLPGVMSSMMKILGTELRQYLTELAVAVEGRRADALRANRPGAPWEEWEHGPMAMATYLNDRAASIYAGANEVQRNIIANALLR